MIFVSHKSHVFNLWHYTLPEAGIYTEITNKCSFLTRNSSPKFQQIQAILTQKLEHVKYCQKNDFLRVLFKFYWK